MEQLLLPNSGPARAFLRKSVLAFGGVFAVALVTGCGGQKKGVEAARQPTVPVVIATVAQRNVPLELHTIGNVQPYSTVQIRSQVSAQIDSVHFSEGQEVKKGDLLFSLDRRQLEADLKKAEGMVAKDEAQLANAQTKAARYTQLFKEGVVARQDYDAAIADADAGKASLAADKAAVDNAKVQLTYTLIYSPIDGRTGSVLVNAGNLVKANDTPFLVAINQITPIYVEFSLPEQQLSEVKRYAASGKLKALAIINSDRQNPAQGELTFIDNAVDTTTGTIKLKGTYQNKDHRLWPGQFVDVVLTLAMQPNAIIVPSVAVQNGQQGQFVYVVKTDRTAETRPVIVTRTYGPDSVIGKGLSPGEQVVTDGQVRLQNGAKVEIKGSNPQSPVNASANRSLQEENGI
jgi:membrane fusion protein, multidrug efflux system